VGGVQKNKRKETNWKKEGKDYRQEGLGIIGRKDMAEE